MILKDSKKIIFNLFNKKIFWRLKNVSCIFFYICLFKYKAKLLLATIITFVKKNIQAKPHDIVKIKFTDFKVEPSEKCEFDYMLVKWKTGEER